MVSSDYVQLALECIEEADGTQDEEHRKALLGVAKLYNEIALKMEAGELPSVDPMPKPTAA